MGNVERAYYDAQFGYLMAEAAEDTDIIHLYQDMEARNAALRQLLAGEDDDDLGPAG